jgi:hypothetical protein
VIHVWWQYVIIAGVLIFGVYGFITLTGFETRLLSRTTVSRKTTGTKPD